MYSFSDTLGIDWYEELCIKKLSNNVNIIRKISQINENFVFANK